MASKEVMVSAPLMVLLFERIFIAGSLANAMRRSWPLYIGLAATWVLLLGLALGEARGDSAGFHLGVPLVDWWLTQTKIHLIYLKLIAYPWPLLIHYEFPYLTSFADAWIYVVPVVLLAIVTLVLLWRNSPIGYLLTFVFAILAPTFVVPIITEMGAERRMYLPLAAILLLFVLGMYQLADLLSRTFERPPRLLQSLKLPIVLIASTGLALALLLGVASANRLPAYYDEAALWRDVLRHQPDNFMAHDNLGYFLYESARIPEALSEFRAALSIKPDYASAQSHLGMLLAQTGQAHEAIEILQNVLAKSNIASAHNNLGYALMNAGRLPEAVEEFKLALAMRPAYPVALNNLGLTLSRMNRLPEAIEHLQHSIRLQPNAAATHNNLAQALSRSGRLPEALDELKAALALDPDFTPALTNLGILLVQTDRASEAIEYFERVVKVQPNRAKSHNNLAAALAKAGRTSEAIDEYHAAMQLKQDDLATLNSLVTLLAQSGRSNEAIATSQQAIKRARANGQEAAAAKIEEWLSHYQIELRRSGNAESNSQPTPLKVP